MAGSLGAEADHWQIVLIILEIDGSLALVAEPTRQAVPCPKCGELMSSILSFDNYRRINNPLPTSGATGPRTRTAASAAHATVHRGVRRHARSG